MHGVEIQDSHVKVDVNGQCERLLYLPAWKGDNCMQVRVFGVRMDGFVVVQHIWRPTGI